MSFFSSLKNKSVESLSAQSTASSASLKSVSSGSAEPAAQPSSIIARDHADGSATDLATMSPPTPSNSTADTGDTAPTRAPFVLQSGETAQAPPDAPSAQPVATQTIITSSTTAAPAAGEETQAAVSATLPTLSGGLESVVGDPKGVAPELIASAVREDSQSSQPWYKRISGKRRASVGSRQSVGSGVGDAEGDGEESVGGASLGSEGVSAETSESSVGEPRGDRDGTTPGPTQLVGDQDSDDTPTLAPSVKDKVVSEHSPDPQTSNERFHALFPQLPEEDELIEDYIGALKRDILVQGKLYVSVQHLSFKANIFGWETSFSLPWSEVTAIEKTMTALVIPNGIEISTANARYSFASLIARDSAYDLFVSLWRHAHPEAVQSTSASTSNSNPRVNDSMSMLSYTDDQGRRKRFHMSSRLPTPFRLLSGKSPSNESDGQQTPAEKVKADAMADGAHPPTTYDGEEFANVAMDVVFPTSPELAYSLMFTDRGFLEPFLVENQKVKELNLGEWTDDGVRETTYIKPLSAPLGPKETLVQIADENENADPETHYTTVTESHTPNVPSGTGFYNVTRTVITWSEGGGAHVRVTTEVVWTKMNRILKGVIERSCLDGQKSYHKDLEAVMREHISANPSQFAVAGSSDEETFTSASTARAPPSGFLSSGVNIALVAIVIVLLFTNFFTLVSLRHQARALHTARIGSPDEVAAAVQRVLGGFSDAHGKRQTGGLNVQREIEGVFGMAKEIEQSVGKLVDRLAGLKG